jgi:hypothetical protein
MSCKNVIMFYESHSDKSAGEAIRTLTPLLKKIGIKSFCFEEPSDENKYSLMKVYESQVAVMKANMNVDNFENQYVQRFLASGRITIPDVNGVAKIITPQTPLSKEQKTAILHYINEFTSNMVDSLEETLQLMHLTDGKELDFCSMDMPRIARSELKRRGVNDEQEILIRNGHMKKKIFEQCEKGDVLVLVGANHFHLAHQLRNEGIKVKEYFITAKPLQTILEDCVQSNFNDQLTCGKDGSFDGLIVDLYNYPDSNAPQLIAGDISTLSIIHNDL